MSDSKSERDAKGRFEPEHGVSVDEIFERMEPLEPYSTAEIAEMLDLPRRTALHYLDKLAEEGRIQKKKPAATRVIWMRGR